MSIHEYKSSVSNWPQLIQAARGGDNRALGKIAKELNDYLLAVAGSRISSDVRAKFGASDVVQLSFVDAKKSISDFSGTTEPELRAWLKKIVIHNLADTSKLYTRTQARSVNREETAIDGMAEDRLVGKPSPTRREGVTRQELAAALQSLPERQRYVVEQRHRDQRSYSDIARSMGISEVAARKLWGRAMDGLRKRLKKPGSENDS